MGSTSRRRRLVINADDLGISPGVNEGIFQAAGVGSVTSASLIANLPSFEDAVQRTTSLSSLSIGLHLNLTTGRPLTAAPTLTNPATGEFHSLSGLLARATIGFIDARDVAAECDAQLNRLRAAGITVSHLDSHRHVHVHPALMRPVLHAASSHGVSHVRKPVEPLSMNAANWRAGVKKIGIQLCMRLARPKSELPRTHFFGISMQGGGKFADRLHDLLPRIPAGTSELMVHPGRADRELLEYDDYGAEREEELRVLCSPGFRELIRSADIELVSFPPVTQRPSRQISHNQ